MSTTYLKMKSLTEANAKLRAMEPSPSTYVAWRRGQDYIAVKCVNDIYITDRPTENDLDWHLPLIVAFAEGTATTRYFEASHYIDLHPDGLEDMYLDFCDTMLDVTLVQFGEE